MCLLLFFCYFYYSSLLSFFFFFFFNDTATTEIYTLSLHDALPILTGGEGTYAIHSDLATLPPPKFERSEEHTSELQSQFHLVCRLLLEKKKKKKKKTIIPNNKTSQTLTLTPQSNSSHPTFCSN